MKVSHNMHTIFRSIIFLWIVIFFFLNIKRSRSITLVFDQRDNECSDVIIRHAPHKTIFKTKYRN